MRAKQQDLRTEVVPYQDLRAHLADELDRLDLVLRLRVVTFRGAWRGRPESSRQQLYIPDEEVDWLLGGERVATPPAAEEARLRRAIENGRREIDARVGASLERGVFLGLPRLARLLDLSPFEAHAVLICLAPELRRRYDRLYAYLQDDITRKRPSVDLILDLLCESEGEKWSARSLLAPQATLLHLGILQGVDDPHSPSGSSGLAQFLKLDPRMLQFILGHQSIDVRLASCVHLESRSATAGEAPVEPEVQTALLSFAARWSSGHAALRGSTLVYLQGARGAGKRDLALAACAALGAPMLVLDLQRLPAHPDDAEPLVRLAFRESLLHRAPLYAAPGGLLLRESEHGPALRKLFARAVEAYGWFGFLAGEEPWPDQDLFERVVFHVAPVPMPSRDVREYAWRRALAAMLPEAAAGELAPRLAERFRVTPGQIRDATAAVAHRRAVQGDGGAITFEALAGACRLQSHHGLASHAVKIEPRQTWVDLVLPEDRLAQLREICSQVRHQDQVYDGWGFGRKLARGRGIAALFSGPPGTGKTMAAEVVADDLQLDLYKVDLARVVSKYVGETEKNLSRIFAEAEGSNAILFFDEADALFGKRTGISDAHDRYANIETSYLLQRMEDYAGVVILASNLSENMDEAFLRRIRFLVEFPFPDAASRLKIWRAHIPPQAPVASGVDYDVLAQRITVAGGNIKNIVLSAAFFAAADGGVIGMEHFIRGARREYEKIGKLWSEAGLH